ncbi:DegT/DnrJ/EryC1/StrS aminotransferase family protein [Micromonospora sp. HM5-17]|jgi:dTDP-4-amino-4,6-dideoxygalactose transaminase|uniref:DegT/DnrJ/EryC1/StrS family aminotransferase n=1 Tax=Micromonospora sp. HM5-17 TaxID=2487710 RepID=UPI000F4AF27F|nr:DegT/DnrJ/EryC1/StrS family aminotransferase [Micromonospora sp. HM5-17]ROT33169.1 DegT/DnrJ/EryC1/StrS family aminotransferase [Micromonospora sp. HM5-17]
MPRIPLVDLAASYARHRDAIDAAIRRVLAETRFILGPEVGEFESAFAAFCGTRHAVGVASGTAAIHLSLAALGVGPGDEVALPAHTFAATAEPVTWLGARPRFVEVDAETGGMDPDALKAVIDRVRAVVPVHLYGLPVDLDAIGALATAAGVPLIEDAAQAHGAEFVRADGSVVRAGAYGRVGCFSFYPGKNLGAFGDAGAVTTADPALADTIRRLADHGRATKYEHLVVGYAARLDTLQAAVLTAKLTTLRESNQRRRELAAAYRSRLDGVGDLVLPVEPANRRGVYHLFVVRTRHRDGLLAYLREAGIGAGVHYPVPLHLQPAYAALGYRAGDLPVTEAWARECLSLPIYPELTEEQLETVVSRVRAYFERV